MAKIVSTGSGLSRRGMLAGAAAASLTGAGLATTSAAPAGDAELLRLGAAFDSKHAEMLVIDAAHIALDASLDAECERVGITQRGMFHLPDTAVIQRYGALRIERGVEASSCRLNDAHDELETLAKAIRALPFRTIEGLAVKVRVLGYDAGLSYHADDGEHPDWDVVCYRGLIAQLDAFEGHTT